ncbi:hypothetical protein [Corallococcus carmarthensis]|nr:hypothetical protein [Corallococcus carmarthensis]
MLQATAAILHRPLLVRTSSRLAMFARDVQAMLQGEEEGRTRASC